MIDFSCIPKVKVDFMNGEHHKSIDYFNELERMVASYDPEVHDRHQIGDVLERLLDQSRDHFSREEHQMEELEFPSYRIHKAEHDRVLAEMEEELSAWLTGGDERRLKHYVEDILPHWLVNHIVTMDTVTATYITNSGGPIGGEKQASNG